MDAFLILMFGLLGVIAIPGLIALVADLLGPTENHRISRTTENTTPNQAGDKRS